MASKDRWEGMQTLLENCGKEGCLFLCLVAIAEEVGGQTLDLPGVIRGALDVKYIEEDFFVNDALQLLWYLTGKHWKLTILDSIPDIVKDEEYTVLEYYNERTGYTHFKRRGYDTLKNSVTVSEGVMKHCRVYAHD